MSYGFIHRCENILVTFKNFSVLSRNIFVCCNITISSKSLEFIMVCWTEKCGITNIATNSPRTFTVFCCIIIFLPIKNNTASTMFNVAILNIASQIYSCKEHWMKKKKKLTCRNWLRLRVRKHLRNLRQFP